MQRRIQYIHVCVYTMRHRFNKTVKRDICCQHLRPCLLHFSMEHQIQSPECEEKFTQSFRLVNTQELRNMAMQVERRLQIGSKSLPKGRKKEERREEERKGEERLKARDPCVTHSRWCLCLIELHQQIKWSCVCMQASECACEHVYVCVREQIQNWWSLSDSLTSLLQELVCLSVTIPILFGRSSCS